MPQLPSSTSFKAISSAICAVLLFGDSAISETIVPSGILASGNPTLSAALIAASNLGPIDGFANPMSSYAITLNLLKIDSKSPSIINLAK